MNKGILLHFQKGNIHMKREKTIHAVLLIKCFFEKKTKELEIKNSGDGR